MFNQFVCIIKTKTFQPLEHLFMLPAGVKQNEEHHPIDLKKHVFHSSVIVNVIAKKAIVDLQSRIV